MAHNKKPKVLTGAEHPLSGIARRIREVSAHITLYGKCMEAMWDDEEQKELVKELSEAYAAMQDEATELVTIVNAVKERAAEGTN